LLIVAAWLREHEALGVRFISPAFEVKRRPAQKSWQDFSEERASEVSER
jgi:hypothetical protein